MFFSQCPLTKSFLLMQVSHYSDSALGTTYSQLDPITSDQIVRTDLQELVDLDLQGHVYGYAPMGDDRAEMEGFRFWKQGKLSFSLYFDVCTNKALKSGYWKSELRGRPYHIR